MITTSDFLSTVFVSAAFAGCVYCIWNGRKVMRIWADEEKAITVPWKDDDNNPANWYLRDPNKFKMSKNITGDKK